MFYSVGLSRAWVVNSHKACISQVRRSLNASMVADTILEEQTKTSSVTTISLKVRHNTSKKKKDRNGSYSKKIPAGMRKSLLARRLVILTPGSKQKKASLEMS